MEACRKVQEIYTKYRVVVKDGLDRINTVITDLAILKAKADKVEFRYLLKRMEQNEVEREL